MEGESKGFLEQLPEELRADPSLASYKDLEALARGHIETKRKVGSGLYPPSADAGPEAWKAFADKVAEKVPGVVVLPEDPAKLEAVQEQLWDKLGRPKDEKGYKLDDIQVPEGVKVEADKVRTLAKEMGWTQAQARKYLEVHVAERQAALTQLQEGEKALRRELGAAFDERVASARDAAAKSGMSAEEVASLTPGQIRVWANVAKSIGGEARPVAGQGRGSSAAMTPAEAQAALTELRARPEFFKPHLNQALHQQLVARSLELTKLAYPDEAA